MIYTTLFNDKYFCGLLVLLKSMKDAGRLNEKTHFILIYKSPPTSKQQKAIKTIFSKTTFMHLAKLGHVPVQSKQQEKRMEVALDKLLLFGLPVDEKVCFFDADMLCLSNMTELEKACDFSATIQINDEDRAISVNGYSMFNTGLFIFRPSKTLQHALIKFYSERQECFTKFGDQMVINHFFYETRPTNFHQLDRMWNVVKQQYFWDKNFDLKQIKLLHYVGIKPWETSTLLTVIQRREWRYWKLNKLWWKHFKKIENYPFWKKKYKFREPLWPIAPLVALIAELIFSPLFLMREFFLIIKKITF